MFTELGIPTYAVWDSDTPDEKDVSQVASDDRGKDIRSKSRRNYNLSQLTRVPIAPRTDECYFCTSAIIAECGAVFPKKYEDTMMVTLSDSEEVKSQATRLYGSGSKPLAARHYAIEAVERGKSEGDPSKYVPGFVKQVAEKLRTLGTPEKQSVVLGIREPC